MFSANRPDFQSQLTPYHRLGLVAGLTILATLADSSVAIAQTALPSVPNLDFQTSGRSRGPNIGDWYTTETSASTDRVHRFFVNVTQADLDAAGGSIAITVNDAESNGLPDEVNNAPDPTRFQLLAPDGSVIQSQIFPSGTANGTDITFTPISTPGTYTITSGTGAFPISGDATVGLNDDDNSFSITVPVDDLLIGQFQGSFQFNGGGNTNIELFFLVGPGTDELRLRNFDLDGGGEIIYTDPDGTTIPGTESGNAVWNGGGNLNTGADVIDVDATSVDDAGRWSVRINNFTSNNQTILEANDENERLPIFDQPPQQAGNFTITQDTTLTTTIGNEVCHPFTVTNNFFTSDIINLTTTGTDPNVIAQLRDGNGDPLTDTDGDGNLDTGILEAGESITLFLCVTPQPGAPAVDVTTITGTSFMDAQVRQQAGTGAPVPQSVEKRTLIPSPSIGIGKTNSAPVPVPGQPGVFDFDITLRVTNTGNFVLNDVQIEENLQEALITTAANQADSFSVENVALDASGVTGTAPTLDGNYNGNANATLFNAGNQFNPGDTAVVTITVRVDLGDGTGVAPLNDGILDTNNTATATGTGPGGAGVTDDSQDGGEVDPDGDGNPTNNNVPTTLSVNIGPNLVLVKRITGIFRQGAALAVPGINQFNDQPGDTNDNALNTALGGGNQLAGIFQLPDGFELQPGDQVEYTLFFWNNGSSTARQVQLCDELQPPTVLNTAVDFQLAAVGPLGTPTFGNVGGFIQGRSPAAPLEDYCLSAPGTFPVGPPGPTGGLGVGAGGGVVAGPFDVPANQFGAIRFRVRLP